MKKPRMNHDDEQLREAAAHVAYEVETMLFAADHLESGHSSPATEPEGKEKDVFLEAFLLHYRNLRAFLCPSLQMVGDDDVLASDFLGENAQRDHADASVLGREKVRINKLLAHISYARRRYWWQVQQMRGEMLEALAGFINSLSAKQQAWFLNSQVLRETFASSGTTRIEHVPETAYTSTVVKTDVYPAMPGDSGQETQAEMTKTDEGA